MISSIQQSSPEEPGLYAGFITDTWNYRNTLRIAGRFAEGGSFAAQILGYRPAFFRPDPQGGWQSFEGEPLKKARPSDPGAFGSGLSPADDFLIFTGIRGPVLLRGTRAAGRRVDYFLHNPEITPWDGNTTLVWLSLDIETDPRNQVRAISLADTRGNQAVLFWGESYHGIRDPRILICENEAQLLHRCAAMLLEWDPDVITGWNVAEFDMAVLFQRFQALGMDFDFGRAVGEPSTLRKTNSGLTRVLVPGRQVVDAMRIMRSSGLKFPDHRLETVANQILGRGKLIHQSGPEKIQLLETLRRESPQDYCLYCLEDATLVLDILKTTRMDELTVSRARLTGMNLEMSWTSIPAFERIYAMELIRRRVLPPAEKPQKPVTGAAGGTVLEPVPGLFSQVMVFDFRSLYPSIMRTFNIDPLSFQRAESIASPPDNPENLITAPNGARFSRQTGILPGLLDTYVTNREASLASGDEVGAFVYKILMNSFYGVLGSPGCTYGRTELAGAITGFGKVCLHFARDFFTRKGYSVLYGDTDSVFVTLPGGVQGDLNARGSSMAVQATAELGAYIQETYKVASRIQLRFETWYRRFLLPPLRSTLPGEPIRGRAKGYAGARGDPETIEIKGMEAARSDYTPLAQNFQRELLTLLFSDAPPETLERFVREFTASLTAGRLDDQLVYKKILRRPAQEYEKGAPPQVRAARLLGWTRQKGRIQYLMTTQGPQPLSIRHAPIDYAHYVQHQLLPVWQSLAEAADLGDSFLRGTPSSGPGPYTSLSPLSDQLELGL